MGANHFVRRRKWERTREVRTATEVAELLLNRGFSEQVILAAFRKAMSSGGVIDFEEVRTSCIGASVVLAFKYVVRIIGAANY